MTSSKLLFGGTPDLPPLKAPGAGAFAPLLSKLSWKYVTDAPNFPPSGTISEKNNDYFKTQLRHWIARVWLSRNPMPNGEDLKNFDIFSLEEEFREYISKNGFDYGGGALTLDEYWSDSQILWREPSHLFIERGLESQLGENVPRVALHSQQLVWLVAAICFKFELKSQLRVLVSDGFKGHCIYVHGLSCISFEHPRGQTVEAGWFSFHDPWPARSFIAPEKDFAGVEVLEDVARPPLWLISPEDLDKVIVGFTLSQSVCESLGDIFGYLNRNAQLRMFTGPGRPMWVDGVTGLPFEMLLIHYRHLSWPAAQAATQGLLLVEALKRDLEIE